MRKTLEERFREKQDRSGGPDACWPWTGTMRGNYGAISRNGRFVSTHRYAWEIANGRPLRPGMVAAHLCNRKDCVNPRHIREMTQRQNLRDAFRDGLSPIGEDRRTAKLTASDVVQIRRRIAAGESNGAIAATYRVTPAAIHLIRNGRNWKHVPTPTTEAA